MVKILTEEEQNQRNAVAAELAKVTRLPIARVLMSEWNQMDSPNIYRTRTGREVRLDPELAYQIDRLPRTGRWIFTASPFPPTIPDKYLEGAQRWAKHQNRRRLRITFS